METSKSVADPAAYEWQPCAIVFPRIGLRLSRFGTRVGLLLPGRYLVRRSRTTGRWIYRNYSD